MNYVIYLLFRISLALMKFVPFSVLYTFSGALYYLLYYLVRYRKKNVFGNLVHSFPEKSEKEIEQLAKAFYRNLSDIFLEGIKGMAMSKEEILKRFIYVNPEVSDKYLKEGRGVIITGAHLGNWEWGALCSGLWFKHPTYILYKQMSNPFIDAFVRKQRAKWDSFMVSTKNTIRSFVETKAEPPLYILLSDQWPNNHKKAYWMKFLNQETAFTYGAEIQSKRYDYTFIFFAIIRVKRGYYEAVLEEISPLPKSFNSGELTKLYAEKLEAHIRKYPEQWLWSHKRWKKSIPETSNLI